MKASDNKTNVVRQEEGGWVGEKYGTPIPEMGDLCLKVRGQGNKAWRARQRALIEATPKKKRIGGRLDEVEQDRINAILLRDTCLLDWKNFNDDDDKPLLYSKDVANKYLTDPEYGKFRDAVLWAASVVAETDAADVEDDAGN